jgi:hypothetical protein
MPNSPTPISAAEFFCCAGFVAADPAVFVDVDVPLLLPVAEDDEPAVVVVVCKSLDKYAVKSSPLTVAGTGTTGTVRVAYE